MRRCAAAALVAAHRGLALQKQQQWMGAVESAPITTTTTTIFSFAARATFAALASSWSSSPSSSTPSSSSCAAFATDARRLRSARSRAQKAAAAAAAAAVPREILRDVSTPTSVPSTSSSSSSNANDSALAPLAAAVSHPALVVARGIEWGNVVLGFEQANKYTVLDETGATVALLAEETSGVGSAIARQALRARRSFVASLLSPDGSRVLARVRRPLYLVNSTTTIEDDSGEVVGEVVQKWHPLRRKYELFIDKVQVAAIDSPLLAWEFTLTDAEGRPIALIDRNFSGFGKELFTDAGRYAVHFGESSREEAAASVRRTIEAAHPEAKPSAIESSVEKALVLSTKASSSNSSSLVATSTGGVLALARPLRVDERLAALAAAIAIDFDYFSRHSSAGGGMMPFMLPMPVPSVPAPVEAPPVGGVGGEGGGEGGAGGGEGGNEGGGGGGFGGGGGGGGGGRGEEPLERDLGGDEPFPSSWDNQNSNNNDEDFGSFEGGNDDNDGGGGDSGWGWDDDGGGGGGDGEGVGGAAGGLFDLLRDIFHQD